MRKGCTNLERKDIGNENYSGTSDSIFQSSDYVLILHRPELFQIFDYGIEKWPTKGLVYLHIVKARDGEQKILCFENHLKHNRLEEYDPYSSFLK